MKRIQSVTFPAAIPVNFMRLQRHFGVGWQIEELASGRLEMRGVPDDQPCGCVPVGETCGRHAETFTYVGYGYTLQYAPLLTPEEERAVQERSAETLHVGDGPGHGRAMGETHPEGKEAPRKGRKEKGAAKEEVAPPSPPTDGFE